MALGSVLESTTRSLLGAPKKALLLLHGTAAPATGGSIKDLARRALSSAGRPTQLGACSALEVHYNPANLSIRASSVPVPVTSLQQGKETGASSQDTHPPSVVLSVQLVFDAVHPQDCFQKDQLQANAPGRLAAGALENKGLQSAQGVFTVQPQTNGLVAALLRDSTRTATFQWADLSFTGQVTNVQAKYTMFSKAGRPVRSTVELSLSQQVDSRADYEYWDRAFDRCFQQR